MIAGWTGHRPDLFRDPLAARASVDAVAAELVTREGAERFLVGGQRGVDTWAALAAIGLGIPYTLILPLHPPAFAEGWSPADRELLEQAIARAADMRVASGYTERNRQLVSGADLLIAVWTGLGGGGTAETMALARAAGTPLREIVLEPVPTDDRLQGRGI